MPLIPQTVQMGYMMLVDCFGVHLPSLVAVRQLLHFLLLLLLLDILYQQLLVASSSD